MGFVTTILIRTCVPVTYTDIYVWYKNNPAYHVQSNAWWWQFHAQTLTVSAPTLQGGVKMLKKQRYFIFSASKQH